MNRIHRPLLPLSWVYGMFVGLRNKLYDMQMLRSETCPIPSICVGNLTVGGTGKTPHVEYLLKLLIPRYRVAVLSRGYKRHSSGYVLATTASPMELIGDEPLQMKQKFPDAHVAVDKDRLHGIARLIGDEATKDTQVILLDDAFQHRRVKAGLNILLIDYNRMITKDALLPAGRLREPVSGKERAHVMIVTKCPSNLKPLDFRLVRNNLKIRPWQKLFFSTIQYEALQPVFDPEGKKVELTTLRKKGCHVLLITGIGNPHKMQKDLERHVEDLVPLNFPDHHYFSSQDVKRINQKFSSLPSPRVAITTEKDATRLKGLKNLDPALKAKLYMLPITVRFMNRKESMFNQIITDYVQENTRNSGMAEKQHA